MAYYICDYRSSDRDNCSIILRSLAAQIIRQNRELAGYVYEEYTKQGRSASMAELKKLLPYLLSGVDSTRLVIDGLDECSEKIHKEVLLELNSLAAHGPDDGICKILVASRNVTTISRVALKIGSALALDEERQAVDRAIQTYVRRSLTDVQADLDVLHLTDDIMSSIESRLTTKAEGTWIVLQTHSALTTVRNVPLGSPCPRDLERPS